MLWGEKKKDTAKLKLLKNYQILKQIRKRKCRKDERKEVKP